MQLIKVIFLLAMVLICHSSKLEAQNIDLWKVFAETRFETQYDSVIDYNFKKPKFSGSVSALHGTSVSIKGYVVQQNITMKYLVISKTPFNSCFFCGKSGPESVIIVGFQKEARKYKIDEKIEVEGILLLNADDPYQFPFALIQSKIK